MPKARLNKINYLALLLFPVVIGASFVAIERYLGSQVTVEDAFGGQVPENIKETIKLNNDIANLFVSLSTGLIAGIALLKGCLQRVLPVHNFFAHHRCRNIILRDSFHLLRPSLDCWDAQPASQ